MAGWTEGGADILTGVTRCGKTTKAKALQQADCQRYGLLPATLDLEHATDWAGEPHAASADEVLECLYVRKIPPRIWTPRDELERAKFFDRVSYWGRVSIIVDGVPQICNQHRFEVPFRNALYKWGHGKLGTTTWYLVLQRAALLHPDAWAAARTVYVFRQGPGADARRIKDQFDLPPGDPKKPGSGTTALGRGEYVPVQLGFPQVEDGSHQGGRGAGGRSPDPAQVHAPPVGPE